eukprot:scaffold26923_cov157-Isochrysis_galbana.AAC.1
MEKLTGRSRGMGHQQMEALLTWLATCAIWARVRTQAETSHPEGVRHYRPEPPSAPPSPPCSCRARD